jgi:histidine ammonia-lyase
MEVHKINKEYIGISEVAEIMASGMMLELSEEAKARIIGCREYLDKKLNEEGGVYYGINTGFGALHDTVISDDELTNLQRNLILSHACGVGEEVPMEIVKLMLFLKVQGLSYGHSACQLVTAERLLDFYNNDIIPVVYQQGSLGASGDLAPLAHMSLPLIGEGEVYFRGVRLASSEMLKEMGWKPLTLKSKEGLALLNGTQFMSAYGVWILNKADQLSEVADIIATISLEAFDGKISPFKANVNAVRNQEGQKETAYIVHRLLEGSDLILQEKAHVQDPYSFRCVPQVHGASKDTFAHCVEIFEREINAVTDNPTIFPEEDEIISAGNFHGQPLALAFDSLCIALAELGSISERRIYKLISGKRGLPPFLIAKPGLNSGLMIPQYTAASIVSQNKQLCAPASIDNIDSSNGQEDHVSMGANAATKCSLVAENLQKILGIEMLNAAQALEFRRPKKSSQAIEQIIAEFRKEVPFIEDDVFMHPLIEKSITFIGTLRL